MHVIPPRNTFRKVTHTTAVYLCIPLLLLQLLNYELHICPGTEIGQLQILTAYVYSLQTRNFLIILVFFFNFYHSFHVQIRDKSSVVGLLRFHGMTRGS